jgi:hypothetical protein
MGGSAGRWTTGHSSRSVVSRRVRRSSSSGCWTGVATNRCGGTRGADANHAPGRGDGGAGTRGEEAVEVGSLLGRDGVGEGSRRDWFGGGGLSGSTDGFLSVHDSSGSNQARRIPPPSLRRCSISRRSSRGRTTSRLIPTYGRTYRSGQDRTGPYRQQVRYVCRRMHVPYSVHRDRGRCPHSMPFRSTETSTSSSSSGSYDTVLYCTVLYSILPRDPSATSVHDR